MFFWHRNVRSDRFGCSTLQPRRPAIEQLPDGIWQISAVRAMRPQVCRGISKLEYGFISEPNAGHQIWLHWIDSV